MLIYLVGNKVKLPEELSHCNGLRVQRPVDDPLLLTVPFIVHQSQRVGENM